jgi:Flp pilus assembly pilin Flp
MNKIKEYVKEFIKEEDGIGVVEIILIIVVLIGLVIIFKKQIEQIVKNILSTISDRTEQVTAPPKE